MLLFFFANVSKKKSGKDQVEKEDVSRKIVTLASFAQVHEVHEVHEVHGSLGGRSGMEIFFFSLENEIKYSSSRDWNEKKY
jgi:hypothetical protein